MTIRELTQNFKWFVKENEKELYIALLVIVIGFFLYGLVILIADSAKVSPVRIIGGGESALLFKSIYNGDTDEVYVASKNGERYHFPWCSGALRINEGNKVSFNSVEEARLAGYTPAKNCKGLP